MCLYLWIRRILKNKAIFQLTKILNLMNTNKNSLINKKALYAGISMLGTALITAVPAFAQEKAVAVSETKSDLDILIANPLFLTLTITIVALLLIIYSLKGVMSNMASFKMNELKLEKSKKVLSLIGLFILTQSAFAQDAAPASTGDMGIGGLPTAVVYGMVMVILAELLVIVILLRAIRYIVKSVTPEIEEKAISEVSMLDSLNASVSLDDEASIMMDHDYDGIRELDNNLPPWWKYGFYATIIFSFVYIGYYHLGGGGKLSLGEYNDQIAEGKAQVEEYRKKSGNLVDETNAKMLSGADIAAGKEVYTMNCAACHGNAGEGTVGPNLTDDYWIHGGSVKDIFKTIKFGFAEKGMKSWEADLSPMQINQVASYIKSLRGTNPPNAKEKQGELYSEDGAPATSETTKTASDSGATPKVDSAAVATN